MPDSDPADPAEFATDELVTRMVTDSREVDRLDPRTGQVVWADPQAGIPEKATVEEEHLEHDEFVAFFRVRNTVGRPVDATLRVFLVADERAEERRFWIELDKFHVALAAQERRVVARPGSLSSVIRKPARMSGQSIPTPSAKPAATRTPARWATPSTSRSRAAWSTRCARSRTRPCGT